MELKDIKNNRVILRNIIEQYFPLNEIVPEYDGASQNSANVFCVFHDNFSSPSGKLYWDDDKDILVLHCFAEHKTYTAYDYVERILCDKLEKYESPIEFLSKNLPERELNEALELAALNYEAVTETVLEQKVTYITNLYNEYDNIEDFINHLYTA